ncbi:hypothetical protein, partial [Alcanivorax sp. HI0044]|uniref:hypothetical protein n=1 Tax=Alcanivorax sp. HI0044 TaxID=1822234 RepID=UPI001E42B504
MPDENLAARVVCMMHSDCCQAVEKRSKHCGKRCLHREGACNSPPLFVMQASVPTDNQRAGHFSAIPRFVALTSGRRHVASRNGGNPEPSQRWLN